MFVDVLFVNVVEVTAYCELIGAPGPFRPRRRLRCQVNRRRRRSFEALFRPTPCFRFRPGVLPRPPSMRRSLRGVRWGRDRRAPGRLLGDDSPNQYSGPSSPRCPAGDRPQAHHTRPIAREARASRASPGVVRGRGAGPLEPPRGAVTASVGRRVSLRPERPVARALARSAFRGPGSKCVFEFSLRVQAGRVRRAPI